MEGIVSKHEYDKVRVPIEEDNPAIVRDNSKCVLCGACKSVCKFSQGVYGNYSLDKTDDKAICINCGQCTLVCPTNAITEVMDYPKVKECLKDQDKIVIFQTSPSVRIAASELFGMVPGTSVEGKIISALRKLGANYVFDTTFGADLTIMEEATELINRIKNRQTLPQFTSCCPAWVNFVETFFPEFIPNLSSAKSPILMEGSVIKTYFAEKMHLDPTKIVNVAVTPCTAKKGEILRPEMNSSAHYHKNDSLRDMDYIITIRELALWLKEEGIDFNTLEDSTYDDLLARGTGAGLIFGNSGGVMEAALRTSYYLITGKNPSVDFLNYEPVRGLDNVKTATVTIQDTDLKVAVINGTFQARKFLTTLKETKEHYDFIEVMSCRGGCIAGGGTPKTEIPLPDEIKMQRIKGLYQTDTDSELRNSYENPDIKELYQTFLGKPGSSLSHTLLHTSYISQKYILGEETVKN